MSNFSIGLSGIDAAKKALDIVGNNMANAATEGYHRQQGTVESCILGADRSYSGRRGCQL